VGTNIEFIDQDKGAPYVRKSFDINRELRAMSRSASSTRSGDRARSGPGWLERRRPQHQPARSTAPVARRGADAAGAESVLGLLPGTGLNGPTITRAQSLRPFPQFGNILMRQNTSGKNLPMPPSSSSKADEQRLGRPHQLHLEPAEGQPVR
jgi:hypothetical protein